MPVCYLHTMTFRAKLTILRSDNRLSKAAVGRLLGVDPSRIGQLEKGVGKPTTEQVLKLSRYFDVTMEYLADDEIKGPAYKTNSQPAFILGLVEELGYEEAKRRLLAVPAQPPRPPEPEPSGRESLGDLRAIATRDVDPKG